ncbi:hypothetical protein NM688_g170 [Phlebia brevispora]|uniref:Uncharacterized protein n=1 Tax=Phlebia brevispora TaxID=194682 RepID=A0ACC1TFU3_9APHY|nr:hypothetical protein NM688_g170 [Phlebia brevispora]
MLPSLYFTAVRLYNDGFRHAPHVALALRMHEPTLLRIRTPQFPPTTIVNRRTHVPHLRLWAKRKAHNFSFKDLPLSISPSALGQAMLRSLHASWLFRRTYEAFSAIRRIFPNIVRTSPIAPTTRSFFPVGAEIPLFHHFLFLSPAAVNPDAFGVVMLEAHAADPSFHWSKTVLVPMLPCMYCLQELWIFIKEEGSARDVYAASAAGACILLSQQETVQGLTVVQAWTGNRLRGSQTANGYGGPPSRLQLALSPSTRQLADHTTGPTPAFLLRQSGHDLVGSRADFSATLSRLLRRLVHDCLLRQLTSPTLRSSYLKPQSR